MKTIIFINGSPGSGKTTIGKLLKEKLNYPPYLELDWIREYHLDPTWKKKNKKEEKMSFENLCFTVKNYIRNSYKNIILIGLTDKKIKGLLKNVKTKNYLIITLFIDNDKELKRRVITESRDSGYTNFNKAIKLNMKLKHRKLLKNEIKINNTYNKPKKILQEIVKLIK